MKKRTFLQNWKWLFWIAIGIALVTQEPQRICKHSGSIEEEKKALYFGQKRALDLKYKSEVVRPNN